MTTPNNVPNEHLSEEQANIIRLFQSPEFKLYLEGLLDELHDEEKPVGGETQVEQFKPKQF